MKRALLCLLAGLALAGCWEEGDTQPIAGAAFGPDLDAIRRFALGEIRLRPPRDMIGGDGDLRAPGPAVLDVEIPKVLSAEDVGRYRRIMTAQRKGDWESADAEIGQIENELLIGTILRERYLSPGFEPQYDELRGWLENHRDLPGADAVHKLALRLKPDDAPAPLDPEADGWQPRRLYLGDFASTSLPAPRLSAREARDARRLRVRLDTDIRRDHITNGVKRLVGEEQEKLLGPAVYDDYRMRFARRLFQLGRSEEGFALAKPAADRAGDKITNAHWIAGLTGWVLKKYAIAASHFEEVATAPGEHDGFLAAGAFWAARAHEKAGAADKATAWLKRAAIHSRTFYGLLARRKLSLPPDFDWAFPETDTNEIAAIRKSEAGRRAFALIQVGHWDLAADELKRHYYRGGETMARTYVALATAGRLAALAFNVGARVEARDGRRFDLALYPVPSWRPTPGFQVDRALIYAVMRQESAFVSRARSPAGARGLMQIMPSTAAFIAEDRSLRRERVDKLYDPAFNVTLGQKYLKHLLDRRTLENNLLFVLSAYNAGEGNLNRWTVRDDPLLFIEAAHFKETRIYVKRVMYNLWAYRFRLGQKAPSLDDLAEGRWPAYHALDEVPVQDSPKATEAKEDG